MAEREHMTFGSIKLEPKTLAQAGDASAVEAGTVVYLTNGVAGSPGLAVSDGTNWKIVDGSATAATE